MFPARCWQSKIFHVILRSDCCSKDAKSQRMLPIFRKNISIVSILYDFFSFFFFFFLFFLLSKVRPNGVGTVVTVAHTLSNTVSRTILLLSFLVPFSFNRSSIHDYILERICMCFCLSNNILNYLGITDDHFAIFQSILHSVFIDTLLPRRLPSVKEEQTLKNSGQTLLRLSNFSRFWFVKFLTQCRIIFF